MNVFNGTPYDLVVPVTSAAFDLRTAAATTTAPSNAVTPFALQMLNMRPITCPVCYQFALPAEDTHFLSRFAVHFEQHLVDHLNAYEQQYRRDYRLPIALTHVVNEYVRLLVAALHPDAAIVAGATVLPSALKSLMPPLAPHFRPLVRFNPGVVPSLEPALRWDGWLDVRTGLIEMRQFVSDERVPLAIAQLDKLVERVHDAYFVWSVQQCGLLPKGCGPDGRMVPAVRKAAAEVEVAHSMRRLLLREAALPPPVAAFRRRSASLAFGAGVAASRPVIGVVRKQMAVQPLGVAEAAAAAAATAASAAAAVLEPSPLDDGWRSFENTSPQFRGRSTTMASSGYTSLESQSLRVSPQYTNS